jgi:hypothetical protein
MKKLRSNFTGIDQGTITLFSDFEDNGKMWSGKGAREVRQRITFSETYASAPSVMLNYALLDLDSDTNPRLELLAAYISEKGCDAVFRTWGDTKVARIRINYTAIGELRDPDEEWDV